ncbi:MAG: arginine N-succinyltransferase [Planctomycetes bacterium]|nr:arginine N-succinyltransferase [Planctomycetota bacterium]
MFVIRQALPDDVPTLLKLARMVHFINLPADADIIAAKVARSARSFAGEPVADLERQFMFVLEDASSGGVIGTSSLICRMGSPEAPQVFLQVRRREHFSRDLNTGAVHTTIQVQTDGSGPSELGGLILAPGYRGHREKLGSLLSLVRFHFLALNRAQFQPRIIAELMGPLTPDSDTLFWEFFGRRFINLSYAEADAFCQQSKEFMLSLLPKEEIYLSTLPAEARNLVGKVGADTRPAKAMLEKQGFGYHERCDPFDGGPYLEAKVDEIPLVRSTRTLRFAPGDAGLGGTGFVSCSADAKLGFRAVRTPFAAEGDVIRLPAAAAAAIGAREGCQVGLTPIGTGA